MRLVCQLLATAALLPGCITLTEEPRALLYGSDRNGTAVTLKCDDTVPQLRQQHIGEPAQALDPRSLRVLIWNVHKQADSGWDRDLAEYARTSDLILLQEAVSNPGLRDILHDAGMRWVMASSFIFESDDVGPLVATRIAPVASCTQRSFEPIIRIPKSAVLSWLPIAGTGETLAVANIHAINFELGLRSYGVQIESLAQALAGHSGPIIVAGDFNTWSDERDHLVDATFARLGMAEVKFNVDKRSLFSGKYLDHIYIRGLEMRSADAIPVSSSDHNPLVATFVVQPPVATQ